MKILMLAENWPPRLGGIENYLTNVAQQLVSDHDVDVVAPRNGKTVQDAGRVQVIRKRFFWPLVRPSWLFFFVWLFRRAKREQYQVTLCGKALFEGLVGFYLKKYLGIPYIVFTYAMEVETWSRQGRQRRKLQRVLSAAQTVVYINAKTKATLLKLGVGENQLLRVYPGIDETYCAGVTPETTQRVLRQYRLEQPYILTVARLIERKGVDVLLEAFSQLDQVAFEKVQLVIVGDGPERDRLEKQAKKLWIDSSVAFLGEVPGGDLPALYRGADIFALTPREIDGDYEGFGIVFLEAAACGTPALATRSGGVGEAVVHETTGLLVSEQAVDDLPSFMATLLRDNVLRRRLGEQARQRAREEFTWEKQTQLLRKMLRAM